MTLIKDRVVGVHIFEDGRMLIVDKTAGVAGQIRDLDPGEWILHDVPNKTVREK